MNSPTPSLSAGETPRTDHEERESRNLTWAAGAHYAWRFTRHFEQVVAENEALRRALSNCTPLDVSERGQFSKQVGIIEADVMTIDGLRAHLATLNKELEGVTTLAKERLALWEATERERDQLRTDLAQCRRERDELKAWKESAFAVESEWDAQAVGKLLDTGLGRSIRAGIQPAVERLISDRDALEARVEQAENRIEDFQTALRCEKKMREMDEATITALREAGNGLYDALGYALEKLDRYANRQGRVRAGAREMGADGSKHQTWVNPNPQEGQHYPAVQSAVDHCKSKRARWSALAPSTDGKTGGEKP